MIVAQTKMKRIPDTCKKCSAATDVEGEKVCSFLWYVCPTEKAPSGNIRYVKPDWCPLMEIDG